MRVTVKVTGNLLTFLKTKSGKRLRKFMLWKMNLNAFKKTEKRKVEL